MVDVDARNRSFGHLISHHIAINALCSSHDQSKRPCAYASTKSINLGNVKITETDNHSNNPPPLLTIDILHKFSKDSTSHSTTAS